MSYIKKLIKCFFFFSLMFLFIPTIKEIKLKEKVDSVIGGKKEKGIYEGYLYIPRFNYENLIKKDSEALDNNLIELLSFSDEIGGNNVILAGHNNRYVFSILYDLKLEDELIVSNFSIDYRYVVKEIKYIKVDDYSIFNNDNSLILITCTNDNQKRYVIVAKRE